MGKTQKPTKQPSPLERQLPNVSIEELIRQQGVKPFDGDFAKIDARWTPEFNFDGFEEWYAQYKAEQRAMPPKKRIL
jgi:hypothetical protein